MIADALANIAISFITWLTGVVNAAWSAFDTAPIRQGFTWFCRLDDWVPMTEFIVIIGIIATIAAFNITWKVGVKIVDWARG